LSELKADPKLAPIPVIIASILEEKNLGFSMGAAEYLTKPFERDRLLAILRRFQCDLATCRVLVIEDDLVTRDLLNRILTDAGCITTTASSGREGLHHLQEQDYDLILLDLLMPEVDGMEPLE